MVLLFGFLTKDFFEDIQRVVRVRVPRDNVAALRLLGRIVEVNLVAKAVEFLEPCTGNGLTGHCGIEGVLAELQILLLVAVSADSAFNRIEEIFTFVGQEGESAARLAVPHELKDRVLQATGAESHHRRSTDKELMLHDATRLELAGHESKVSTAIDKCAVRKEKKGICPEAVGVLFTETEHSFGTFPGVWVVFVSWATHEELNLVVILFNDFFRNIKNQMNTLLVSHPANESKDGYIVIETGVVEVLLLENPLGFKMIGSNCIQLLDSLFDRNAVGVREGFGFELQNGVEWRVLE